MTMTALPRSTSLGLRAGDWVVVRAKEEILETLDERGRLEALPFQPEMLAFCGRRMRVAATAHKTCDNIMRTGGRAMHAAVHLEGARCDGSAHGGCQADCVFYWKEAWLRRAEDVSPAPVLTGAGLPESRLWDLVRAPGDDPADPTWVCHVTTVYEATTLLHWWDVRQYIRDVTGGNHTAWYMVKLLLAAMYRKLVSIGPGYNLKIAFYNRLMQLTGGHPYPLVRPQVEPGQPTPTGKLDLQPGEWVEVKSPEEIDQTITPDGMNRGMRYDMEMNKYSGHRYRVQMRVDRLISEKNGKMTRIKNPCIQLENVYCRAECTEKRLGCPRASNTYWREVWLRRIEAPGESGPDSSRT